MKNYHWVKYFHVNSSLSSKFWKSGWMKIFFEGSTSLIFYQGKRKNLINWAETKYSICTINLALDPSNCSSEKATTYFDFRRSYFKGACLYQKYFWRTRVQTIEQNKNTWKVSGSMLAFSSNSALIKYEVFEQKRCRRRVWQLHCKFCKGKQLWKFWKAIYQGW